MTINDNDHTIRVSFNLKDALDRNVLARMGWLPLNPGRPEVSRSMVKTKFSERVTICDMLELFPAIVSGRIRRPFQSSLDGAVFPVELDSRERTDREYLSLVTMQLCLGLQQIVKTEVRAEDQKGRTYRLRMLGVFRDQAQIDQYQSEVIDRCFKNYAWSSASPDFWWDVDNHIILSFDQKFMAAWPSFLVSMLKTVNSV